MAILLGDGAGGFSHTANSPLASLSANTGEIVIGDFNEDGNIKIRAHDQETNPGTLRIVN